MRGLRPLSEGARGQPERSARQEAREQDCGRLGGSREGVTHCSSSRQRRPHSPQTGCSGWSSQCRCRHGSGTRPRRRPSLEQHPPRDHQVRVLPVGARRPQARAPGPKHQPRPPAEHAEADPVGPGDQSSARVGWGGSGGPTHCCRESRPSRPRSRLPRCTKACWTHNAHCCTGGRSSCSGVSLRS